MPRIRKKSSKRGTTRQREKIKHKVSEHRKKAKKQARKNKVTPIVQTKSKKDPGIPNNFPYKDQILAEVAQQRRQEAQEKQHRKEEKRAAAAGKTADVPPEDVDVADQEFDGILSLRPTPILGKNDDRILVDQIPSLPIFPGPSTLRQVVHGADVVLHVVDARDPIACVSDAVVQATRGKLALLLNKADTVPRESLAQWLTHLRMSYTVLPFRVSSAFLPSGLPFKKRDKKAESMPMDDALGLAALGVYLDKLAREKNGQELVVAVTGVTNVGKSSVINSIVGSDVFSIYDTYTAISARGPYTTTKAQEVVATLPSSNGRKVRFIDTPGLRFARATSLTGEEREMERARDVLLRCRGRIDRLKDPLFGAAHIVMHGDTQDLMLAYNLPAFLPGDVTGFLAGLARVSGLIKKRGVLDHADAARIVLRDWSAGKLMRYSMPGGTTGGTTEEDTAVLGSVRSRKVLRSVAEVKMVKMNAGVSDKRDVEWDVEWKGEEEEEEEEDELSRVVGRSGSGLGKRKVSFGVETGKRRR